MKRTGPFLLLLLVFQAPPGAAADKGEAAPPDPHSDLWTRTRESAAEWWDRSGNVANDWWARSRETVGKAWEGSHSLFGTREDHFAGVWDRLLPNLGDTLALQEKQADLPATAWLGPDQTSNEAAINSLLDEAVDILSTSSVNGYRDRIRTLQSKIEEANRKMADYRQRRVSAPLESMVQTTVADYDRRIDAQAAEIRRWEQQLRTAKREFATTLKGIGLEVSGEQVDFLLATVVGDNIVDLGTVFDNVKAVTVQLQTLVEGSSEDLESARRYYGMYVILLRSLNEMHLRIERAIAQRYIPQIDSIANRAQQLTAETLELQQQSPRKNDILVANLEAQRLTVQAAALYRQYLVDQAQQVTLARKELETDIAAAWNTYETVRLSGELVALFKSRGHLLDGLLDRQIPQLRPFANLEMKREFEKLTEQLRAAQAS